MKQRYFLVKDNQNYDNTLQQCIEWKSLYVFNCDVLAVNYPAAKHLEELASYAEELSEEEGAKFLADLYINREKHESEFFYYDHYMCVRFDFKSF